MRTALFSTLLLVLFQRACSGILPISGGKYQLSWVRNISVHRPGYLQLPSELPGRLVATSFEGTPFFGHHAVFELDVTSSDPKAVKLPGSDLLDWPNAATGVDASVFGFTALAIGSGFLVPSHTTGGIWVLDAETNASHLKSPVKITKDKADVLPDSGWFYHMAHLQDFNNDGKMDILTARAQYGVWPWAKKRGELLWLEHPTTGALQGEPWKEHHIAEGPDFLFCVHPDNRWMVAPEYIGQRIVLYEMKGVDAWTSRVLDSTAGPGFGCSWTDLNGDGRLDLLVTNHQNQNGSVYAYAFDSDDLSNASAHRHVLATGFDAISPKTGTASPGDAFAFHPEGAASDKQHVLVSGDNSNSVFLLTPNSQDKDDWTYTKQLVAYLGADIGRPAIGDVDHDGYMDVFIPAYDVDVVVHYKFEPSSNMSKIFV